MQGIRTHRPHARRVHPISPQTAALGPDLREMLDAFWTEYANTDVHFYVESYRFCEFIQQQIARGRTFAAEVAPALDREMSILAERLEVSHTEIYSPLREQRG